MLFVPGTLGDSLHSSVHLRLLYKLVSNTSAVSSINLTVDTHLCKLRDTAVARYIYIYILYIHFSVITSQAGDAAAAAAAALIPV